MRSPSTSTTARKHREADAACGREWVCACAVCRAERGRIAAKLAGVNAEALAAAKNAARLFGRIGGLKGGPARARALTAKRRREIAAKGNAAMRRNAAKKETGGPP